MAQPTDTRINARTRADKIEPAAVQLQMKNHRSTLFDRSQRLDQLGNNHRYRPSMAKAANTSNANPTIGASRRSSSSAVVVAAVVVVAAIVVVVVAAVVVVVAAVVVVDVPLTVHGSASAESTQ